jgi:hypothetical protein
VLSFSVVSSIFAGAVALEAQLAVDRLAIIPDNAALLLIGAGLVAIGATRLRQNP